MATITEAMVIGKLLEASLEAGNANALKSQPGTNIAFELSFAKADQVIEAKLNMKAPNQKTQIVWIHESFDRCTEYCKRDKIPQEFKDKFPDLMRMLARYAHLVLNMPMMFCNPDTGETEMDPGPPAEILCQLMVPPSGGAGSGGAGGGAGSGGGAGQMTMAQLMGGMMGSGMPGAAASSSQSSPVDAATLADFNKNRLSVNFIGLLVTTIMEEEGDKDGPMTVHNCFLTVLDRLSERLRGRGMADMKLADVNYLVRILERKTYLTTLFLQHS